MTAGWVAGSVRATAMARRRLGDEEIARIAASARAADAVEIVARSPYGRTVPAGAGLDAAERGIAETLLWHMRVLAGWLPADGAEMLRLLAGWFEIANVDEHMAAYAAAGPPVAPFRLGTLGTAWTGLSSAGSVPELRAVLARSPWGDPGDGPARAVALFLRLSWADRVAASVPAARPWAAGGAALLVAGERFVVGQVLPEPAAEVAARVLGSTAAAATGLGDFARRLPAHARWALAGVDRPDELWRAESRWWARLRRDGRMLLGQRGFGAHRPLGTVAVLAADARQARAALEVCARGGAGREVLDGAAV